MVVRLRWGEETLYRRFGPGAEERLEPVVQRGVGHGAPALLPQVVIPACDDKHLDELPGSLGLLEEGPANRAGPSAAPAHGLHGLLEIVLGPGLDLVADSDEDRAAAGGRRHGRIRGGERGVPGAFGWGSLAVTLTLLAGVRWRFSSIATYDLSPALLAAPDMPLAVPVGGPVFVTVTYQVQPGAEDDFQEAVQPLGWSRRRTGAVRWAVLQHAESPGQFVEIFVVASWAEYLRQQGRRTVADAALDDRLRAFLRAGTEPEVERFLTPSKPHHHDSDKRRCHLADYT